MTAKDLTPDEAARLLTVEEKQRLRLAKTMTHEDIVRLLKTNEYLRAKLAETTAAWAEKAMRVRELERIERQQ